MKRFMLSVATACAAGFVHAATVAWGGAVCDPTDPSGNTPTEATYTAYLVYSATEMSSIATRLDSTGIGAKANNGGSVVATWGLVDDAANFVFSSTWERTDEAGGVNGWYQMLLVDEKGKRFGAANETFEVTKITDITSAGEVLYNLDNSKGYSVFIGDTGWTGTIGSTPEPVPEPTSGLLILLGVAGMALRRRRV